MKRITLALIFGLGAAVAQADEFEVLSHDIFRPTDPLAQRDDWGLVHQGPRVNATDFAPRYHWRWIYYLKAREQLVLQPAYVGSMQVALRRLGYYCGPIDGVFTEQVIRPTGLIDPPVEVRPVEHQVDDLIAECREVARRGYRVLAQHAFAGYKIDLVVSGTHARLAVECDGEDWNGQERYDSDMARRRQLERCGWRFWRIRGGTFYRNPESAMQPLWDMLEKTGIKTLAETPQSVWAAKPDKITY